MEHVRIPKVKLDKQHQDIIDAISESQKMIRPIVYEMYYDAIKSYEATKAEHTAE